MSKAFVHIETLQVRDGYFSQEEVPFLLVKRGDTYKVCLVRLDLDDKIHALFFPLQQVQETKLKGPFSLGMVVFSLNCFDYDRFEETIENLMKDLLSLDRDEYSYYDFNALSPYPQPEFSLRERALDFREELEAFSITNNLLSLARTVNSEVVVSFLEQHFDSKK